MKKTALFTALVLTAFSATAYVGYSGPENQPHALGATGTSSAPQPITENGTGWEMKFIETSTGSSNQSTGIDNYSFDGTSVNLSGTVQTPQPCYKLDADTEERGENLYALNVTSERLDDTSACADVISYKSYNATLDTEEAFRLEIIHDGDTVEALEHPDYKADSSSEESKGLISGLVNWFTGLFSDEPETVTYQSDELDGEVQIEEGETGNIQIEER